MASSSAPTDVLNGVQLLITASEAILGAARALRMEEKDGELKVFYADVTAYCAIVNSNWKRVNSDWKRVSKAVYGVDADLIYRTLDHLESAIAPDIPDHFLREALPSASHHGKLRAFSRYWGERSDNNAILRYIRFGANMEERDQFIQLLAECEKELGVRYPENEYDWTLEELPTNENAGPSSFAVWNAAQSIFEVLVAYSNCDCIPTHEAQLRLGTHRKNTSGEANMDECLDFDMFLFMKQGWRETHVLMAKEIKESVVQFQANAPIKEPKGKKNGMRLKQLCEPIGRLEHQLNLKVTGGQIFKLQSKMSTFLIDRARSPITLEQFLRKGSHPFTEKTKRILAVMLSYAVLYLHDTQWLQPTWSSSHVLFLPTTSSSIPLQPFIQTHLISHSKSDRDSCISPEVTEPDGLDPDDLLVHRCPLLVTLAVMLMELYFAVPFDILAKQYGADLTDYTQSPISTPRYLDVILVYEACKGEIPESYQFHYAVKKCLDPATWEDEDENKLDSEALVSKIYQEVVKPLETELCQAYSEISTINLDEFAKTIDIANWGPIVRQRVQTKASEGDAKNHEQTRLRKRARSTPPSCSPRSSVGGFSSQRSAKQPCVYNLNVAPGSIYDAPRAAMIDDEYRASRFFDDEVIAEACIDRELSSYRRWKFRYREVYDRFIPQSPAPPSIRIAILDTGIDIRHPDIAARLENIQDRYNWIKEDGNMDRSVVFDQSGHGTFAASLILDYAPDAQLYVAKIADSEPSTASLIAKAINYAVSTWKVDIISMSFGFPACDMYDYQELEDALANAQAKRVLLFAAASNSGGRQGHAYPARDQNVIAIHATDTYGNPSTFSPTAIGHDDNFATVGQAIESAWPVDLCDKTSNPQSLQCKSGTSFATPIAAGIAAFLLMYAKIHFPGKANALKSRQRMQALLKQVAEKEVGQTLRGGYHFIDLSMNPDSLFGKPKDLIDATIRNILNT